MACPLCWHANRPLWDEQESDLQTGRSRTPVSSLVSLHFVRERDYLPPCQPLKLSPARSKVAACECPPRVASPSEQRQAAWSRQSWMFWFLGGHPPTLTACRTIFEGFADGSSANLLMAVLGSASRPRESQVPRAGWTAASLVSKSEHLAPPVGAEATR